jgi:hypothetical protein
MDRHLYQFILHAPQPQHAHVIHTARRFRSKTKKGVHRSIVPCLEEMKYNKKTALTSSQQNEATYEKWQDDHH